MPDIINRITSPHAPVSNEGPHIGIQSTPMGFSEFYNMYAESGYFRQEYKKVHDSFKRKGNIRHRLGLRGISNEERIMRKFTTFGIMYGGTHFTMAEELSRYIGSINTEYTQDDTADALNNVLTMMRQGDNIDG